jgi:hypothetical protein
MPCEIASVINSRSIERSTSEYSSCRAHSGSSPRSWAMACARLAYHAGKVRHVGLSNVRSTSSTGV